MFSRRLPMFDTFQKVSKSAWLAKIEKDLKGKSVSEMLRRVGGVVPDPFCHAEDLPNGGFEASAHRSDNDWLIGEDFYQPADGNYIAANKQLLSALMQGVNAPCLLVTTALSASDMATWLQDVALAYIELNLVVTSAQNPSVWLPNEPIVGTLDWSASPNIAETLALGAAYPTLRVLAMRANPVFAADLRMMLADMLGQMNYFLEQGNPLEAQKSMFAEVFVDVQYFAAIAQIRALNLLMANVLAAWSLEPSNLPSIHARLLPESMLEDGNTNMIRATTQAMSAALGGAQRITIRPSKPSDKLANSVARNVHHVLKLESYLDQVYDPAHGSYYIETLTRQLAEDAWSLFLSAHEV